MIGDKGDLPISISLSNVVTSNKMNELAIVFATLLMLNTCYLLYFGNSLGSKIMAFCFKSMELHSCKVFFEPLIQ